MKKEEVFISKLKTIIVVLFLCLSGDLFGQIITSGQITFTRRTNLEKRFADANNLPGRSRSWMKEPKEDKFVLYFDENSSLFAPLPGMAGEEEREWATTKTTTYMDLSSDVVNREFSFMGSALYLNDTLLNRKWVITGLGRDIAGYRTRQAMWEMNDSTKIYAWYSEQIIPSVGPETYFGLPGAILGLAIEDGGVVYFAEKVEELKERDFKSKMPKAKEKRTYEKEALIEFVRERSKSGFGSSKMLDDVLIW